jgi:hypothetical protein
MLSLQKKLHLLATNQFFLFTYSHFSALIWIILFAIDVFFAEKAVFTGYKSISLFLFSLKSTFIDHSFRY